MTSNKKTSLILAFVATVLVIYTISSCQNSYKKDVRYSSYESKPENLAEEQAKVTTQTGASSKLIKKQLRQGGTGTPPKTSVSNGKYVAYMASQSRGIVGAYKGLTNDNPADNIFNVSIDQELNLNDRVWLNYELKGVSHHSGVVCSVNDRFSFGGYLVKTDSSAMRQRVELNPAWVKKGNNQIRFGIAEGVNAGYEITNFAIEVERESNNDQMLTIDGGRVLYDGKAYIHGFIRSGKKINVQIDGRQLALRDKEFETLISPSSDSVTVQATIDGQLYSKVIRYTKNEKADYVFEPEKKPNDSKQIFDIKKANRLETNLALLKAPAKTLLSTCQITASDLRNIDLPALDLGMTNVTEKNRGVRFLPHGEHFKGDGATVALKYDRTKIPDGYTENDIRTYYFNTNTKHWEALERDTVDKTLCMVVSKTTHFTDMINGVITTPESPETQGFAPTMMNDIKAADPTSKIELIAPPTANNQGSANLSYPIELPPARNGMSPQLAITYNSDGGSGWLGEGWDLNVPSITVDTKFGVPTYNSAYETETYCLSGVMLARAFIKNETDDQDEKMFFPDRGVVYKRNKNEYGKKNEIYQFYPRIEGNFQLIERIGTQTYDYKWRVADKSGTKYYYGYEGAVLSKDTTKNGKIAEWKLQSMVDIHGDSVAYLYNIKRDEASIGLLKSSAVYLNKIQCFSYFADTKTYKQNSEIEFFSNSIKNP